MQLIQFMYPYFPPNIRMKEGKIKFLPDGISPDKIPRTESPDTNFESSTLSLFNYFEWGAVMDSLSHHMASPPLDAN